MSPKILNLQLQMADIQGPDQNGVDSPDFKHSNSQRRVKIVLKAGPQTAGNDSIATTIDEVPACSLKDFSPLDEQIKPQANKRARLTIEEHENTKQLGTREAEGHSLDCPNLSEDTAASSSTGTSRNGTNVNSSNENLSLGYGKVLGGDGYDESQTSSSIEPGFEIDSTRKLSLVPNGDVLFYSTSRPPAQRKPVIVSEAALPKIPVDEEQKKSEQEDNLDRANNAGDEIAANWKHETSEVFRLAQKLMVSKSPDDSKRTAAPRYRQAESLFSLVREDLEAINQAGQVTTGHRRRSQRQKDNPHCPGSPRTKKLTSLAQEAAILEETAKRLTQVAEKLRSRYVEETNADSKA